MKNRQPQLHLRVFALSLVILSLVATTANAVEFPEKVNQFLSTYCVSCHGPDKQKGKLRLDTLSQDLVAGPNADDWHEVLDALSLEEMPPEDEKQPQKAERAVMIEFFQSAFKEAAETRRSTGGQVVMRRLTNYEYNNTINDLLGLNEDWSKDFPPDVVSEDGFKNNGFYMGMSSLQMDNYVDAATLALDKAMFEGNRPELKTLNAMNLTSVKGRESQKGMTVRHTDKNGTLLWDNPPTQGPVLVEVVLSGVTDFRRIDRLPKLEAGVVIGYAGHNKSLLFSLKEVMAEPVLTKEGELVRFQYLIPEIQDFPQIRPTHRIPFFALRFSAQVSFLDRSEKINQGVKVESMIAKGPYYETWPPKSHRRIFIPSKNEENQPVYAREVLSTFMAKAWRRPVEKNEVEELYTIYENRRKNLSFVKAIKECLVRVLVSPDFLYLVELKGDSGKREKLSPHELSNRLSYFLWSSKPDERLFKLATDGDIISEEKLRTEVRRMLQDDRSWRFVEQFTTQWLELDRMGSIAVSPEIYPGFDEDLKNDMRGETLHFFAHLLREDESALNIIDSDFSLLSERMHFYYKGHRQTMQGSRVVKRVALDPKLNRGGVLSQASIHMALSDGEDSHLISRAVWLADKILGDPPPPPPAAVNTDLNIEGFEKLSKKQQIVAHVEQESCARCHTKFDPYGVAFENFDAIGKFRTKIRKLDQKELDKRRDAATVKNPEGDFRKIDTSGDGYLQKDEWFAHLKATVTSKKRLEPKHMEKSFYEVAQIRQDTRQGGQQTHPKGTVSMEEYKGHRLKEQRRSLKSINKSLPYLYVNADASTVLPDSTKIKDLDELKEYLLKNKNDEFAENVVRRLLSYALGRSLEFSDDEIVQQLTRSFQANDYKLATLVEEIVLSNPFQTKYPRRNDETEIMAYGSTYNVKGCRHSHRVALPGLHGMGKQC